MTPEQLEQLIASETPAEAPMESMEPDPLQLLEDTLDGPPRIPDIFGPDGLMQRGGR